MMTQVEPHRLYLKTHVARMSPYLANIFALFICEKDSSWRLGWVRNDMEHSKKLFQRSCSKFTEK